MMTYPDGAEMRVGDAVSFENGRAEGTIEAIVERDHLAEFGVDEPGVMLKSDPFGRVFIPQSLFGPDNVSRVERI
jgi:hypothetical protein